MSSLTSPSTSVDRIGTEEKALGAQAPADRDGEVRRRDAAENARTAPIGIVAAIAIEAMLSFIIGRR